MAKRWHYQMLMEDFGPVTTEQISVLIAEGTLSDSDLVRAEDSDQWMEVSQWSGEVSGLIESTEDDASLGQITDLSELSFEFEESPTTPRASRAPVQVQPAVSSGRVYVPNIQADAEPSIYFYQSLGQTFGPLPFSTISALVKNGEIHADDPIRIGVNAGWQSAKTVEPLAAIFLTADTSLDASQRMSIATQTRLGTAASSAAMAVNVPQQQPAIHEDPEPATNEPSEVAAVNFGTVQERPARPRKSAEKGKRKDVSKRREEAVLEDIFDDVFAQDEPETTRTSRPIPALAPPMQPAAPAASASMSSSAPAPAQRPVSTPSQAAAVSAAAYQQMASLSASTPSRGKSSISMDSLMPFVKVLGLLILVGGIAAGGYFGWSSVAGPSIPVNDYAAKLKAAASELTQMGATPTEAQWTEFAKKHQQFKSYQDFILEHNAYGPEVDKCKAGIMLLLRVTSTPYNETRRLKQHREDFLTAMTRM